MLGDDRVKPSCWRHWVFEIYRAEADDLDVGQSAAQERHRLDTVGYGRAHVKEYQVAARVGRFLDRGRPILYCGADFVWSRGFDEIPNGTAHGGTVINNKESGLARTGHRSEKLLRIAAK